MKLKNKKSVSASALVKLKKQAFAVRKNAHAPYSGFQVGAAILTQDDKIFDGCNVENASYGATICAERGAILKAVSQGAKMPLKAVYVMNSSPKAWPPCGMCLQVLSEFCTSTTLITISNKDKLEKMYRFSDLLPESFDPQFLKS
jgi:cytidine deaminase